MNGREEHVQSAIRQYQERLDFIRTNSILCPSFLRKKVLIWLLRSAVATLFYILFWKYPFVRWSLIIAIPVCLLNIISVFTWKYLLQQKLKRNEQELQQLRLSLQEGK